MQGKNTKTQLIKAEFWEGSEWFSVPYSYTNWCARKDSNPQHPPYKGGTLPIELRWLIIKGQHYN